MFPADIAIVSVPPLPEVSDAADASPDSAAPLAAVAAPPPPSSLAAAVAVGLSSEDPHPTNATAAIAATSSATARRAIPPVPNDHGACAPSPELGSNTRESLPGGPIGRVCRPCAHDPVARASSACPAVCLPGAAGRGARRRAPVSEA
jgi:hypothetical protein